VIGALGVAAASLRMNYLPVVLVISLVVPLLAALDARHRVRGTALLVHCAVAVCSVAALHMAYRQSVAVIFNVPPSYLARAGFMQLGLVTPLITDAHLQRAGLPPDLRAHLQFPLAERRARMPHMWAPGGLVHELRRRSLDVEAIARQLSRDALTDNPLGVARLGIETVGDYFRKDGIEHALHNDLGRREIPPDLLRTLRNDWRYDATGLPTRDTVVSRYFAGARWWLVGCLLLLAPLSIANAVVHWHTPWRTRALLAALVGLGLVAAHVLFVAVAFYRYLHPLPLFVFVNAVPLGWRIWHARRTP
jgi:hypothetical protein